MSKAIQWSEFFGDSEIIEGYLKKYDRPWEAVCGLKDIVAEISKGLDMIEYYSPSEGVYISISARVSDSAEIIGPAIIMADAELRHSAYIRGGVIVGKGALVGNSSEVKNTVLLDGAKLPHFNYAGDSIIGCRAHLGAGAIISNLRLDKGCIRIRIGKEAIDTGMKKLGALIGEGCEIGCGSVINPGSVIEKSSFVYPLSQIKGYYNSTKS